MSGVDWQDLTPNAKNAWLTAGLEEDFETFVPLGSKAAKASFSANNKTIFKTYSMGVSTNRDEWVYDFDRETLESDVKRFIASYNGEVERWIERKDKQQRVDEFVNYNDAEFKWSLGLKNNLKRGAKATFTDQKIRTGLYRPFCKRHLFFDSVLLEAPCLHPKIFPTSETKNRVIVVSDLAHRTPFSVLMTDCIPDLHLCSTSDGFQTFPLYTYSADGSARFDNVTGWALDEARRLYGAAVSREDVFYATYALLHHPSYRAKYAENLKRELPRIPLDFVGTRLALSDVASENATADKASLVPTWSRLTEIGRALGDLHVGYESAPPFPFSIKDTTPDGKTYSFHVEKMKWADGKTQLVVNDSITLAGFTPEMFEYKLGNRSALDWVVECYRVKRDERSGLVSDPNRPGEPKFILDLIARVATVSLETQKLVAQLPTWLDA